MSILLNVRRFDRPDQPQSVYQVAVDAKLKTYAPIWQHEATLSRTESRLPLDVRLPDWSPEFTWVTRVVDTTVRTWNPVFSSELAGARSPDRVGVLNVRQYDWAPAFGLSAIVDAIVQKWGPAFSGELKGERSPDRSRLLDVRGHEWSAPAWIFSSLPPSVTVAQRWPAILEALGLSYRSGERTQLDVRWPDWAPSFGWSPAVVDSVVRTWLPVFDAEVGERTRDRAPLDVRAHDWGPWGWLPRVANDPIVSQWAPIWNASVRTADRAGLDVRRADWSSPAWIFAVLPTGATVAQQWPALLQALGLSYRSPDRTGLDVRAVMAPDFTWPSRVVDATVQSWLPAITSALRAVRTVDRLALDVRVHEWSSLAWLFTNLPPAVSVAQQWPAILQALGLSYRMGDRLALDVRADLWSPEQGWVSKVVDGVLARYAPTFAAELQTFRSGERARLDVRGHEWLPEFGWVQRPVDVVVSRWAPIFAAEVGLWTPSRAVVEVRVDWSPETGWIWFIADQTHIDTGAAVRPVGRTVVVTATRRQVGVTPDVRTVQAVTSRTVSDQLPAPVSTSVSFLLELDEIEPGVVPVQAFAPAHGLIDGDRTVIAGANVPEYNGTFEVFRFDDDVFSYFFGGSVITGATGPITSTKVLNPVSRTVRAVTQRTVRAL